MPTDLRLAFRQIVQQPGFAALAALTLALGIGANTAIFSVVEAALLRPLPFAEPRRLISVGEMRRGGAPDRGHQVSYPDFSDLRREAKTARLAAWSRWRGAWNTPDGRRPLRMAQAGADFFDVLGIRPQVGRLIGPADVTGKAKVAVVSDAFWRSTLHADPGAIGRTMSIDGEPWTVVGVLPASFEFAPTDAAEVWRPLAPEGPFLERRNMRWVSVLGRLAPGATLQQARAELADRLDQLAALYPQPLLGIGIDVRPLREVLVGDARPVLLLLFGAVGVLLLIACVNVANLFLVRASARRKEIAVRAALGATRGRIARQLLTEATVIAAVGGLCGALVASWVVSALVTVVPLRQRTSMPWLSGAHVDAWALGFTALVALGTGVLFGLLPALQSSRADLRDALGEEAHGSAGPGRRRVRQALVAVELALALTLAFGAGLVARSLARVLAVDPGFDMRELVWTDAVLPDVDDPHLNVSVDRMLAAALALPGAREAAAISSPPLTSTGSTIRYRIPGDPADVAHEHEASIRTVTASYFHVAGIRVLQGRDFETADNPKSEPVMVVSRSVAQQVFPGQDAIGRQLRFTYDPKLPPMTIVGVVDDVKLGGLDEGDVPALYVPYRQNASQAVTVMVRGAVRPDEVRRALAAAEPEAVVMESQWVQDVLSRSPWLFARRWPALLVGAFAGLALLLAVVGVYGVMAVSVAQRTREIGIRLALGAERRTVAQMVLRESALVAAVGLCIGAACAVGCAQLARNLLFGISASDPVTLLGMALLLLLATLAASWLPALRATRVNPLEALRA